MDGGERLALFDVYIEGEAHWRKLEHQFLGENIWRAVKQFGIFSFSIFLPIGVKKIKLINFSIKLASISLVSNDTRLVFVSLVYKTSYDLVL